MNQRIIPVAIVSFFTLMASSIGYGNYRTCRESCTRDLDRALHQTLQLKTSEAITPDTIRTFRRFITIDALRNRAFVTFATPGDNSQSVVSSRQQQWQRGATAQIYRGYSLCSFADIMALSDQRLPMLLMITGIGSAALSMLMGRKRLPLPEPVAQSAAPSLALTPMQQQLMDILTQASGHLVSQQTLCEQLWQNKDNAPESLYTLIRRLRKVLDEQTDMRIELERGKGYRLVHVKSPE